MSNKNTLLALGLGALLLPSLAAQAQVTQDGSISLGYVGTTGNTETRTFNTDVLYTVSYSSWQHSIKFQGLISSEDSNARAERYYLEDKSDYVISDDDYVFIKANYTDDRFSGFDYQAAASGGYGHYFYNRDDFMLEAFGGMGYRQSNYENGGSEGEVIILSAGQNLEWDITDTSNLVQSLTTEIGEELTVTRFEIGLTTNIMDSISTKIAFQARNTSDVPAGRETTDTQTSISLVYDFF